jgi:F-type H+-transporting ATPase subunit c
MDFFSLCMIVAGFGMAVGVIPTSLSQGMAIKSALEGVARNPGASGKVLTTMMIGLAMIESLAIYVFVVAMIILFANPFTQHVLDLAASAPK